MKTLFRILVLVLVSLALGFGLYLAVQALSPASQAPGAFPGGSGYAGGAPGGANYHGGHPGGSAGGHPGSQGGLDWSGLGLAFLEFLGIFALIGGLKVLVDSRSGAKARVRGK